LLTDVNGPKPDNKNNTPDATRVNLVSMGISQLVQEAEQRPAAFLDEFIAAGWFAYRRFRFAAASAAGRNPLCPASALLPFRDEARALTGLVRCRRSVVEPVCNGGNRTLWKTPLGPIWAPKGADAPYVRLVASEMLSEVYPLTTVPQGATVIDAGANIGCFSRYAYLNGAAQVISFEPSPGNLECLRENVPDADIIEAGVWDRETVLSFSTGLAANPGSHHVCEDGSGDTSIPVTSIDAVASKLGLTRLDYIKMDVEGAEVRALQGGAESIRRFRPQLAIATEHTDDLVGNTRKVIDTIQQIAPDYRYVVTESQWTRDCNGRMMLIPYTLHFSC
jgi:FkbM family methyltransferase